MGAIVAYFKVLFHQLSDGREENHEERRINS
jgi:hypothetical protein